jgi:hypothetical protein
LIDSIGYTDVYQQIAEKTGLTYCEVQKELNLQLNQEKSLWETIPEEGVNGNQMDEKVV